MASMVPYDRYNRAIRGMFDPFGDLFAPLATVSSEAASFKMNVEDTGDAYVLTALLPGVTRDQIDVELNEGRLSVTVDVTESDEDKGKNYIHKETTEWSATRGVYLKDAATMGLAAKLVDGVLTVTVPKQDEKANVTKITIE